MSKKTKLILHLYDIGVFKFGDFILKSGISSPIYIDLRLISSYPKILKEVALLYIEKLKNMKFDRIAGVPYAAIPLASAISVLGDFPMIYTRKEAKDHGLKKMIEGVYEKEESIVIIEDLVTKGISILEVVKLLEEAKLRVIGMTIFLDREQGGIQNLESKGYKVVSIFKLSEVLTILKKERKITEDRYKKVINYLNGS